MSKGEHLRKRYITAKFWNTLNEPNFFPELDDKDFSSEYVMKRRNLGICFSGGGTRSAAATLGQLRGLKKIGLLEKAGYISAVSGGAWGSAPYTFLPEDIDDNVFLGNYIPPKEISRDKISKKSKETLAKAISETVIADDFFKEVFSGSGDESYSRAIGRLFLKPFGLDDTRRWIAYGRNDLNSTIGNNKRDRNYFLKEEDFYLPKKKRPFFIAGGTILRPNNDEVKIRKIPCEYTPIYTGVRGYFPDAGRRRFIIGGKRPIGGGYLQTLGYDNRLGREEYIDDKMILKSRRNSFTLVDIIGSSGAAPQEILMNYGGSFLGFPEFLHIPIPQIDNGKLIDEEEYAHGDGGHIENLGIMPLLARKVENIIVFINTPTPFEMPKNLREARGFPERSFTDDLAPLFGRNDLPEEHKGKFDRVKVKVNQVFDRKKMEDLIEGFRKCKSENEPLIYCDKYKIKGNEHYNISEYEANICWVYLENVNAWVEQIKDEKLKNEIEKREGEFERFPNYKTFFENKGVIDLSIEQVNLLSQLTSWIIVKGKERIEKGLNL